MTPKFVTFTGIDVRTNLQDMISLSRDYPIEWGVLFGNSDNGNRYPPLNSWCTAGHVLSAVMDIFNMRFSAHLCGKYAKQAMEDSEFVRIYKTMPMVGCGFRRIQVNSLEYNIETLQKLKWMADAEFIIIQHRDGPFPSLPDWFVPLHDQSGGKGILPSSRPIQEASDHMVGYAGGINPDNVNDVLSQIHATNFWIDMESGVRDENDWFDISKCAAVCKAIWG